MNTKNISMLIFVVGLGLGLSLGFVLGGLPGDSDTHSEPTKSMEEAMHKSGEALEVLSGADFDHTFLEEMIVHHEGAIDMARLVKERSERPELREFASDIISLQTQEISQMKRWLVAWPKPLEE